MKKYTMLCTAALVGFASSLYGQFTKSFNDRGVGKVSFASDIKIQQHIVDTAAVVRSLKADPNFSGDLPVTTDRDVFNYMDSSKSLPDQDRRSFELLKAANQKEVPVTLSYHDIMNYIDTSANASEALKQVVRQETKYKAYYDAVGITSIPGALIASAWAKKCDSIKNKLIAERAAIVLAAPYSNKPDSLNRLADTLSGKIRLYGDALQYFQALNVLEGTPKFRRRWFPLRSVAQAQYFYFDKQSDKASINLLSNFALQTDADSKYAASADIVSGIFPIFKRVPLKLDIGTTIAQDKDSATESKAAGKVLYGGLIHAGLTYPLFFSNWDYWDGKSINIYIPLSATINFDNVSEGSQLLKDAFYFGDVSASLYLKSDLVQSADNDNLASIFLNGRFSFIAGGSEFYDNLPGDRKGFCTFQVNAGIRIMNQYSLAINLPVWSSNRDLLNSQNATIALIIDPNFSKSRK